MAVVQIKSPRQYIGLSSDTKPTSVPEGTTYYAYDTGLTYVTYDGTNYSSAGNLLVATKTSSSPLTTGTLFTYTGAIEILRIIGTVTTVIQHQATNVKLSIVSDALAAYDICANKDIDQFAVGSLLHITGTAADALIATTAVGASAPTQAAGVVATCITSGTITVTYGAASTGAIKWDVLYQPLTSGATLV